MPQAAHTAAAAIKCPYLEVGLALPQVTALLLLLLLLFSLGVSFDWLAAAGRKTDGRQGVAAAEGCIAGTAQQVGDIDESFASPIHSIVSKLQQS